MKYSNILFLKQHKYLSIIKYLDEEVTIYSLKSEINKIAKSYFFSINEYFKHVRKETGLKNKIPIYFSNNLLLFKLGSKEENYYINFFKVMKICYEIDSVIIFFINNEKIEIKLERRILNNELSKIQKVLHHLRNL